LPSLPDSAYGIEPERFYPGDLILEILEAVEDEAAAAVSEAFALGYQEGRIDGSALWRPVYEKAAEEAREAGRRPTVKTFIFGVLGGVLAGFMAGALWGGR
jgi:hypothetical protein